MTSLRRGRVWMLVAGVVATALALLLSWHADERAAGERAAGDRTESDRAPPRVRAEPPSVPAPSVPVTAVVARGSGTERLGSLLQGNAAFADDVVFLVVASVRTRCEPAHAHELAAMAAQARLPMLAGVTEAIGTQPTGRTDLLAAVRDLAARAPCTGPFVLTIGGFTQRVDTERYAAAFPDSYFDPSMDVTPQEFTNRPLADRARDECGKVAYAVLPLDAPRAWQCAGLRAQGRERVRSLCAKAGEAEVAAVQIRDAVGRMPATCQ
ncbi:hypothetical protein [Xanthomonas sp. NCPPB 2632]|jgi:hypothetical protein|uniref:hypothetical protein n=1 Tax=Xanthomonas sp. NCPPB 2632 TaxID=3240912 RepID=UPI003514F4E3